MKIFIISFDLCGVNSDAKNNDYATIDKFLKNTFVYCVKPLNNVYLVASEQHNSVSIRESLRSIIDSFDTIFVGKLEGEYASWNYANINKAIELIYRKER